MSHFIRSNTGVNNYHHFTDADFTVVIEGKPEDDSNTLRFDEVFYKTLLKVIYPNKKFKIKCHGNKRNVLEFFNNIEDPKKSKTFCIIDKDLSGFTHNILYSKGLMTSYYYSWENEFWSESIVIDVIESILPNYIHDHTVIKNEYSNIKNCLFYLSKLDACLQLNAENLFPKKRKGLFFKYPKFSFPEIKRLTKSFKTRSQNYSAICAHLLNMMRNSNKDKVIQGHLIDHISYYYISGYYQNSTVDKKPSEQIIKGIAATLQKQHLPQKTKIINHYKNQIDPLLI